MKQGGGEKTFTWDDPAVLLGIIGAIYVMCWGAWYFAHEEIAAAYTYFRYVELWPANAVGALLDLPGISVVYHWMQDLCSAESVVGLCTRDFSTVQWREISDSSFWLNAVFLVLTVFVCIRMFIKMDKTHPKSRFSKTHNIKSFVEESQALYPHLRMFSKIDLISQPLDHPIFGMSLTSRQFVFRHQLISGWKAEADKTWTPTLDRKKATEVMRRQLGLHWTRSTSLTPGETLLLAIAVPRVAATNPNLDDASFKEATGDCDAMLEWCWSQFAPPAPVKKGEAAPAENAWLKPDIDLSVPRAIIQKYMKHENVKDILHKHAFVRTILCALFTQARRLGVLPPAEMRWMRFYDRELWYCLQTIGRQASFPEAPAVLSHYLYECKAGTSLAEPQLDKAVSGLEIAMLTYKYLDNDKQRYEAQASVVKK